MTTSATERPPCSPPSTCSTAWCSDAACNSTATRSSSASSTPSKPPSRPERSATPSSTTTGPRNIPRSAPGWLVIPDGCSTSRPHQLPGSTPSRGSSRSSPEGASAAASSNPSSISRPPSTATAVGARTAMKGLTYKEVEGSVDCAEDCSGHNAGFAYAQEHDIEDDTGCKSGSASYVEGCEAYGQQIEQCVNAAREAVMQGRPPADRCPLLRQSSVPTGDGPID